MKNFSARLKSLQKEMNTSEFARFLGVKQQTLDNYLKDKRTPTIEFVETVCNKCCKSADWLLGLKSDSDNTSVVDKPAPGKPECAGCKNKSEEIARLMSDNSRLVEMCYLRVKQAERCECGTLNAGGGGGTQLRKESTPESAPTSKSEVSP